MSLYNTHIPEYQAV